MDVAFRKTHVESEVDYDIVRRRMLGDFSPRRPAFADPPNDDHAAPEIAETAPPADDRQPALKVFLEDLNSHSRSPVYANGPIIRSTITGAKASE